MVTNPQKLKHTHKQTHRQDRLQYTVPLSLACSVMMMDVVLSIGAIRRAKLQSNHHHQQTNIEFLQARCPSCHPTNSVKALKGNWELTYNGNYSRIVMKNQFFCSSQGSVATFTSGVQPFNSTFFRTLCTENY